MPSRAGERARDAAAEEPAAKLELDNSDGTAAEPARDTDDGTAEPPSAGDDKVAAEAGDTEPEADADAQITLVLGGDLGLGGSGQRVDERGARRHGKLHPFTSMTADLAPLIDGDINFANLETIVTPDNKLSARGKRFVFKSHPAGVRHLVETGFNVFSTANNHVGDYGIRGIHATLDELEKLRPAGLLAFPGLGKNREAAATPAVVDMKKRHFLFSAVGIGGWSPGENTPGMLGYSSRRDFDEAIDRLASTPGDYRVLSVHYGAELSVRPDASAVRKFRDDAILERGIDLVVGHHAHVAAGVEQVDGRLIFYGLGNLLHPGMQDMSRFNACRDYGLLAKVHLGKGRSGRLAAKAIEVWALDRMHIKARPMTGKKGKRRIAVLNKLARGFDNTEKGARGVRFMAREDGSGLACLDGASSAGGRIGKLCGNWSAKAVAQQKLGSASCASRSSVVARRNKSKRKYRARRRAQQPPNIFQQIFGQ